MPCRIPVEEESDATLPAEEGVVGRGRVAVTVGLRKKLADLARVGLEAGTVGTEVADGAEGGGIGAGTVGIGLGLGGVEAVGVRGGLGFGEGWSCDATPVGTPTRVGGGVSGGDDTVAAGTRFILSGETRVEKEVVVESVGGGVVALDE
jgi:hypothetical protein